LPSAFHVAPDRDEIFAEMAASDRGRTIERVTMLEGRRFLTDLLEGSLLLNDADPDIRTFRAEARQAIQGYVGGSLQRRGYAGFHWSHQEVEDWMAWLNVRGWAVPNWPAEHGGGWLATKELVLREEQALAGAPQANIQGSSLIGPLLCKFGSPSQKERYLPLIRNGSNRWAQGFSEPGAGSDLASLTTSASFSDGRWIINGRKIWTSEAHLADMIYCLVRTDRNAKPQAGLSLLLVDAKSPGITISPIIGLDGAHSLNEVTFDDVEVAADQLVGEPNRAWTYAKFLLANERAWAADIPGLMRELGRLAELMRTSPDGRRLSARVLAAHEAELLALKAMTLRALVEQEDADVDAVAWPAGNVLKLRGAVLKQQIYASQVEVIGRNALGYFPIGSSDATPTDQELHEGAGVIGANLMGRAVTIWGGASEVQRDIIARHVFVRGVA
jgi:alkylation response protein AidB-like acyl-CoA dehydrogenase